MDVKIKSAARRIVIALFLSFFPGNYLAAVHAQGVMKPTVSCNPINLNYRFQLRDVSRREAADPTIALFKGRYYLFASKSGGYWISDDLVNWSLKETKDLPIESYAPTAAAIDDTLYFMAINRKICKSTQPETGKWEVVNEKFPIFAGDPCLFLDDDGKLYLYYSEGHNNPLYGIELDKKTFMPIGERAEFFRHQKADFGWERPGDYNTGTEDPWIEGAWMTKHNGKYYLQYAAPGTAFKSYADGLYTGDEPLGTFKIADNNPFSYKPEGFACGAGHGSTFQDKWGNYWHISTISVSVKHDYERRLGLFPAFFDKDGVFYTYTGFGDYPHSIPQKKIKSPDDYQPAGMLLSYKKKVEVSSSLPDHPKEYAADEEIRSYWSAASGSKGEWIIIDLQDQCRVSGVQLNFAEENAEIFGRKNSIYHQYILEYSNDKIKWEILADKIKNTADVPHDFIELSNPVKARFLRLTNVHVPDGNFALSGFRAFGKGSGKSPKAVSEFSAARDQSDGRNVKLKWNKIPNATGYNIRYGTAKDKLYLNYQVFDTDSLVIHSLSRLKDYYFTIDAFNENGITKGKHIQFSEKIN
ncbi:family 43 glycosylhydrolase [Flavobacterium luteolum]|uniref:family 43 glycosylhydrolase n=1 Tax=Flavobacterium luteolum TaxID=3003259 RepID=UPI00248D4D18|nr:family 43 glycosylhydrolase [Flavobacterium luteolum]